MNKYQQCRKCLRPRWLDMKKLQPLHKSCIGTYGFIACGPPLINSEWIARETVGIPNLTHSYPQRYHTHSLAATVSHTIQWTPPSFDYGTKGFEPTAAPGADSRDRPQPPLRADDLNEDQSSIAKRYICTVAATPRGGLHRPQKRWTTGSEPIGHVPTSPTVQTKASLLFFFEENYAYEVLV